MPQTRRVETTLAACSLVAGLLANFAGFMLIGRLCVAAVPCSHNSRYKWGSLAQCSLSQRPIGNRTRSFRSRSPQPTPKSPPNASPPQRLGIQYP